MYLGVARRMGGKCGGGVTALLLERAARRRTAGEEGARNVAAAPNMYTEHSGPEVHTSLGRLGTRYLYRIQGGLTQCSRM